MEHHIDKIMEDQREQEETKRGRKKNTKEDSERTSTPMMFNIAMRAEGVIYYHPSKTTFHPKARKELVLKYLAA